MIQTVVKRDGRIVGFNEQKIMAAIRKAMLHTDKGEDERLLYQITDRIAQRGDDQMTVEQIQVLVFQKSIKNISMTASLRPTILNLDSDWA